MPSTFYFMHEKINSRHVLTRGGLSKGPDHRIRETVTVFDVVPSSDIRNEKLLHACRSYKLLVIWTILWRYIPSLLANEKKKKERKEGSKQASLSEKFSILQERWGKKNETMLIYVHLLSRLKLEHRNSNIFSSQKQLKRKSGWKCSRYFLSVMAYALFANLSCPST